MATVNVTTANTFEEWRVKTNELGTAVGNLTNLTEPLAGATDIVSALADHETRTEALDLIVGTAALWDTTNYGTLRKAANKNHADITTLAATAGIDLANNSLSGYNGSETTLVAILNAQYAVDNTQTTNITSNDTDIAAINTKLGTISAAAMGTTAATVGPAILELHGELTTATSNIAAVGAAYVAVAGDTMTGTLVTASSGLSGSTAGVSAATLLTFGTGSSTAMQINSSQRIGIGTTAHASHKVDVSGNLNATTLSYGGTDLATTYSTVEEIQDIVGAMVASNTETGITVTYQDSDGTLDFAVASQTANDFTNTLKAKLDAIEASADVTDTTNVVAALSAGTGVAISGAGAISVTAVALTTVQTAANQTAHLALTAQEGDIVVRSDENKTYCHNGGSAGSMADYTLLATPTDTVLSVAGNTGAVTAAQIKTAYESNSNSNEFSDAEQTKLSGIETSATADQTGAQIKTLYQAESSAFTDAQFTKLAGIETSAKDDQTGAQIKTLYEAESNAFTDAQFTKLSNIETAATADQTGAQIKTLYEAETNAFTDTKNTKLAGIATSANLYVHPNHSGEVTSTADGATVIADNVVDEANLKISNSPTNGQFLSAQSGNTGGLTWAAVDALPSQSGNSGKFLTTNATTASWATVDALPSQGGNAGKYLTTDATNASWATLDTDANTTTKGLYEHSHTITANYAMTAGNNALTAGPITINSGITVTVPSGSTWVIA